MTRPLRVLAALFLVPLVIFATPNTAVAATSGTLVMEMMLGADIPAHCQITWARTSTGVSIGAASRCDAGPDLTPYSPQPIEGDAGMYGLVFKSVAGDTCGGGSLPARDIEGNDVRSVAAGLGAAFIPVTWHNCVPVHACLSYVFDQVGGLLDTDTAACVPFPVDPPTPDNTWHPPAELPFGMCDFGTPEAVNYDHVQTYVDAQGVVYVKDKLRLLFNSRSLTGVSWTTAEREWRLDVLHSLAGEPPTRQNAAASGLQLPAGTENQPTTTDATGNSMNPTWQNDTLWLNNPSGLPGSHTWKTPAWHAYGIQVTNRGNLQTANIPVGYTNPSKCTFWLGPQIRATDHPTYGLAKPWNTMGTVDDTPEPDPVPPTEVEPEPVDPDTDVGLLGAILSVLRSLWAAIKGIAGAIGDVLEDLFIPESGFMDEAFKDVRDAWSDTTLAKFGDVFEGAIPEASGMGCSGLPLNLELPGGVQVQEKIGAACDGPMATTAGIVRSVVTAALFVGGGIACLRGIGAGFGWRPSIGRGVDQ